MFALSLQSSRHLCFQGSPSRRWSLRTLPLIVISPELQRLSRTLAPAMAATAAFQVAVKGNPDKNILGDCMFPDLNREGLYIAVPGPFCQRALLTLEEKHVPYTKEYIDFDRKPAWLLEVNPNGSVPVAKDLETNKWIVDSGVIADYLEDKYPEPHLGKSDQIPAVGSKLFPAFVQFLKAPASEEAAKKEAYLGEVAALSDYLKQQGPYLLGTEVSAGDLALAPKLYHAVEALKEFKGFEIPAEYRNVVEYLQRMQERPSWKACYYPPSLVVAGWQRHLQT